MSPPERRRSRKRRCFLLPLCLLAFSCGSFHMRPLRIVAWSPRDAVLPEAQAIRIWVEFSSPPDRIRAEEAFSLEEDGDELTGVYSWNDGIMHFTPHKALSPGRGYRMEVSIQAEDRYGNSLESHFAFSFRFGVDGEAPRLLSCDPVDGAVSDDPYQAVTFVFSEAVDRGSLYGGFTLTPPAKGWFDWSEEDRTVVFTPLFPLTWQQRYTVSVSASVADRGGNRLTEPYSSSFRLGSDTTPPTLVRVSDGTEAYELAEYSSAGANAGWEGDRDILIRFSEPVDRDSVEWHLSFEPDWEFSFHWPDPESSDRVLLESGERLVWQGLYTLRIPEQIADFYGNTMGAEFAYTLLVDGPGSRIPLITGVTFLTVPGSVEPVDIVTVDAFGLLDLSGYETEAEGFFDVYIRLAEGAAVDPASFMRCFTISRTNGCAVLTPAAVRLSSEAALSPPPNPLSDTEETVVRIYTVIDDDPARNGVVSLMLDSSFEDSIGNPLPEGWQMPLVK